MIPKKIHYCWFGEKDKPEKVLRCIDSWKRIMPDYEIKEWNEQNFDYNKYTFTRQAYNVKKYAFVSDVCRLWALYTEGGLYFDTDIEVIRSFDELLDLPYILGAEKTRTGIESATIGFEKGSIFVKKIYDRYTKLNFVKDDGSFDMTPIPNVIRKYIESTYTYNPIKCKSDFIISDEIINVFSSDFFSPKTHDTKKIIVTENTFSIHHFYGSWIPLEWKQNWAALGRRDECVKNNASFSDIMLNVKVWIRCHLLLRRSVVVVSLGDSDYEVAVKFGLNNETFSRNFMLHEDEYNVLSKHPEFFNKGIIFRKQSQSKYANDCDFQIVGQIEGTNIEILFKNVLSKVEAKNLWLNFVQNINGKRIVFIHDHFNETVSRFNVYKYCVEINIGKNNLYPYNGI